MEEISLDNRGKEQKGTEPQSYNPVRCSCEGEKEIPAREAKKTGRVLPGHKGRSSPVTESPTPVGM